MKNDKKIDFQKTHGTGRTARDGNSTPIKYGSGRKLTQKPAKKRYHLSLPEDLYSEIDRLANENGTTIIDLIRRFVKLGLTAVKLENDPNAALIIREGNRDRELSLLI